MRTDWNSVTRYTYETQKDAESDLAKLAATFSHNYLTVADYLTFIGDASRAGDRHWGWTHFTDKWKVVQEPETGFWYFDIPKPKPFNKIEDRETSLHVDVTDMVNHPPHYTQGGMECIDAIEAMLEDDSRYPYEGYLCGQVLKYLWRYPHKNGQEDLQKARWYLDRLIRMYDSQKG